MGNFFQELRRRKVFRVAAVYVVVAWVLIQVAATVLPALRLPEWTVTFITVLLILGFPVALVLAWALELTPEGIKRTPKRGSLTSQAESGDDDGAASLAVQTRNPRSIAVLPFENMSPAENDEYFASAIHDEILTQLAKLSTLKVISRTSVMEYRNLRKNLREIARELGVATILEGGVQKVGDKVRINVQLIDAETDGHRWAESYDRKLTVQNILAIQREMSTSIVMALRGELSPEEEQRLAEVPTENTRAYNFYLAGNYYFTASPTSETMTSAVEMYEQAVMEDPKFAWAHARLARAHLGVYVDRVDWSQARLDRGEEALRRAVELDPESPEVWLAQSDFEDGFENKLELLGRAREAMPGNPDPAFDIAMLYRDHSDWEKALEQFDKLIELDPRNRRFVFFRGITHAFLRQHELADEDLDRVLAISPGDGAAYLFKLRGLVHSGGSIGETKRFVESPDVVAHLDEINRVWFRWLAALYERDYSSGIQCLDQCNWDDDPAIEQPHEYYPKEALYGTMYQLGGRTDLAKTKFEEARAHIEAQVESRPRDWRLQIALGEALAALGRPEEAVKSARRGMEMSSDEIDESFARIEATMRVFLPAEDYESVITELDKYLAGWGPWSIEGLLPDPRLDPIRDDPRFQALVGKYRRQ